jgi:hypothetical protein
MDIVTLTIQATADPADNPPGQIAPQDLEDALYAALSDPRSYVVSRGIHAWFDDVPTYTVTIQFLAPDEEPPL